MSSRYVIVGIDPGFTTGVFVRFSDGGGSENQLARDDIGWYFNTTLRGLAVLYGPESVHVAIERYIITARTAKLSQQPDALEVTGAIGVLAAVHGITDVRQYLKANLKFASDDMLRTMGWYNPKMRHANDAARQASALLKEVDYPRWCELVKGGTLDTTTDEPRTNDLLCANQPRHSVPAERCTPPAPLGVH